MYLVRHGETVWNANGRFQGALDSPLTDTGRAQARAIGDRLAAILPAGVGPRRVVSPLGRARETAEIIGRSRAYPPVEIEPRIREVSLGSWDGLSQIEIDSEWPGALDGATAFDWFFRAPDGESFDAAFARAQAWLDEIEGTVVAVSHGLIGRLIRGAYLGLPKEKMLALSVSPEIVWHLSQGRQAAIDVQA